MGSFASEQNHFYWKCRHSIQVIQWMFTIISGNLVKFLNSQPRVLKRLVETQKEGPNLGTIIGSPITHIKISATKLRANG